MFRRHSIRAVIANALPSELLDLERTLPAFAASGQASRGTIRQWKTAINNRKRALGDEFAAGRDALKRAEGISDD